MSHLPQQWSRGPRRDPCVRPFNDIYIAERQCNEVKILSETIAHPLFDLNSLWLSVALLIPVGFTPYINNQVLNVKAHVRNRLKKSKKINKFTCTLLTLLQVHCGRAKCTSWWCSWHKDHCVSSHTPETSLCVAGFEGHKSLYHVCPVIYVTHKCLSELVKEIISLW